MVWNQDFWLGSQAFLKANVEIVDAGVTANLLASYGRMDDLMHFASYREARGEASSAMYDTWSCQLSCLLCSDECARCVPSAAVPDASWQTKAG